MIKSIKYLIIILSVLIIVAGIATVVADSDSSIMTANEGGSGSFNSEDSFGEGDGSFTSDDSSDEYIGDDSPDEEEQDETQDNIIRVGKHVTSNPILLLFISLMSCVFIVKYK